MPNCTTPSSPHRVNGEQRAQKALALRCDGLTWVKIKEELGYRSCSGPLMAVRALLNRESSERAAEFRKLNSRRLERMLASFSDDFRSSRLDIRLRVAPLILNVIKELSKLHGSYPAEGTGVGEHRLTVIIANPPPGVTIPEVPALPETLEAEATEIIEEANHAQDQAS